MKSITWDIVIASVFLILLLFCILIRRHKALSALVGVYISYIVTVNWGDKLADLFTGDRVIFGQIWFKVNIPRYQVQVFLFLLVCFLIISFVKFSGRRSHYSNFEVSIYVLLAVALGTVFVLSFLPADLKAKALNGSRILPTVNKLREYMVLIPVFAMIFFGFYNNDDQ